MGNSCACGRQNSFRRREGTTYRGHNPHKQSLDGAPLFVPRAMTAFVILNYPYFLCSFSATRAFTIFFRTAAGSGLSTGKRMVPLDT